MRGEPRALPSSGAKVLDFQRVLAGQAARH